MGARLAQNLLDVELAFVEGMIAATSLPGFAIVNGVHLVEFVAEHGKDFGRWIDDLKLLLRARDTLKSHAPALYDALCDTTLGEVLRRMPDEVTGAQAAYFVGQLVALLTVHRPAGVAGAAQAVATTLGRVILPAIGTAIAAGKAAAGDLDKAAVEVVNVFKEQGVELGLERAKEIVGEYSATPELITAALTDLARAVEDMGK
jgi:phage-related minor tail protein